MALAHAILYRALQAVRREPVFRILRQLEESQWWSPERLAQEQERKLARVLDAAWRAPHYRRAWTAVGTGAPASVADLRRLPILMKQALRDDPRSLRNPAWSGPVNRHVTTGSSGVPLTVERSRYASACGRAAKLRGHRWHGVAVGDLEMRYGGLSLEALGRRRARMVDWIMNRVRLDPGDLSETRLAEHLALIRRLRPRYLYGYPSALARLAAHAERSGVGRDLGLQLVLCSSESLFPHRREIISRAFGCPVRDEYGAAEVSIIAMECGAGSLHLASENVLMEVVDEAGESLRAGETGESVVTDLNNLAAPLVRYRLGDRVRFVPERCACERGLPCVEVLQGSAFGLVRLPGGRVVSGVVLYFLAEALLTQPDAGLREIQFVRRGEHYSARIVPRPEGNAAHRLELVRRLGEILGPGVRVDLEEVERIERQGGDKYRILVEEPV